MFNPSAQKEKKKKQLQQLFSSSSSSNTAHRHHHRIIPCVLVELELVLNTRLVRRGPPDNPYSFFCFGDMQK